MANERTAPLKRLSREIKAGLRDLSTRPFATWSRVNGRRTSSMLLISDGEAYTSEQQFAPLRRMARTLAGRIGLVTKFSTIEKARALPRERLVQYDIIGLKMSFRADRSAVVAIARDIRDKISGSATRFIYFDGDDDQNVLWPELIGLCDRYVKKHAYRNRADYAIPRIGKSNLTDHVARAHGRSFENDPIPSCPPVDPSLFDKIDVGWNIGLDDKIVALSRKVTPSFTDDRPVDVCSRAVVSPDSWIYPLRGIVADRLETMATTMTVLVPRNRVAQDEYYKEMLTSTICVSPFGYGELCWRDFEAILCGCLLVKPDMGHVETAPDIFMPGITYVPVKWDYSDLAEVCRHYLDNVEARRRIVAAAYRAVIESHSADWFVDRVERTLSLESKRTRESRRHVPARFPPDRANA